MGRCPGGEKSLVAKSLWLGKVFGLEKSLVGKSHGGEKS